MHSTSLIQTSLAYKSPGLPVQLHTSAQAPNGSRQRCEILCRHDLKEEGDQEKLTQSRVPLYPSKQKLDPINQALTKRLNDP